MGLSVQFFKQIHTETINSVGAMVFSSAALAGAAAAALAEGRSADVLRPCAAVSAGVTVVQIGAAALLQKLSGQQMKMLLPIFAGIGVLYALDGIQREVVSLGQSLTTVVIAQTTAVAVAAAGSRLTALAFDALQISNQNQRRISTGIILGSLAYFGTSLPLYAFPLACGALTVLPIHRTFPFFLEENP